MRFVQLVCPEGALYVDVNAVDGVGPSMTDTIGGRSITMRLIYLRGGQGMAILDTPDNLQKLGLTANGVTH